MKSRLQRLWDDVLPRGGTCSQPRTGEVLRRLNAALDAPSERRMPVLKQGKLRTALIAAALMVALAGSAVAVAANANVLELLFGGDIGKWQDVVDSEARSVEDENYILTVASAMADANEAMLQITLVGKTPEAQEKMRELYDNWISPSWAKGEHFLYHFQLRMRTEEENAAELFAGLSTRGPMEEDGERGLILTGICTAELGTCRETPDGEETAEWYTPDGITAVRLRFDLMAEDLWLEVPLEPAPSAAVEIGRTGRGFTLTHEGLEDGSVYLERVTLSPFSISMEFPEDEPGLPVTALLMRDGSVVSWAQLGGSKTITMETRVTDDNNLPVRLNANLSLWGLLRGNMSLIQFQTVLDYDNVEAVLFDGFAYPLDGGEPWETDLDQGLRPFLLESPLEDPLERAVPLEELCEKLGAQFAWDEESQTAEMTYRGVTIAVTVGSDTVYVDGEPEESRPDALFWQDGVLYLDIWSLLGPWDLCRYCVPLYPGMRMVVMP